MRQIHRNARSLRATATDAERTRQPGVNGDRVLRSWNDDVLLRTDAVLDDIHRAFEPPPNPPLRAGDGAGGTR